MKKKANRLLLTLLSDNEKSLSDYSLIKKQLDALGPEPIEKFQTEEKEHFEFLNDLYHTESVPAFRLKLACYGIELSANDIAWLCESTAYHAAFWPHTKPRFFMLKRYLRFDKDAGKKFSSSKFRKMLKRQIVWMSELMRIDKLHDTPGKREEISNYKKFLKLSESIYTRKKNKR